MEKSKVANFGLYLLAGSGQADPQDLARLAVRFKIRYFQLRLKEATDQTILSQAARIRKITNNTETRFIINDRVDLALIAGADGVHLGQGDLSLKDADEMIRRYGKLPGVNFFRGLSTHSIAQLKKIHDDPAGLPDYAGFGPIWPTPAKKIADPPAYPG